MRFYKKDISIELGLDDFIFLLEDEETDHILGIIEQLSEIDEDDEDALSRLGEEQGFKIIELDDNSLLEEEKGFVEELNKRLEEIFGDDEDFKENEWDSLLDVYTITDDLNGNKGKSNKIDTRSKEDILLQEIVEMFEHVLL